MTDKQPAKTEPPVAQDQQRRWLKYGTNVAVFVLATFAIVILVNWIGFNRYFRMDFTATGLYTLSPQTRNLLDGLETDVRFTMLYAEGTEQEGLLERVEDLLAEYGTASDRVRIDRIDPVVDPRAAIDYVTTLRARFDDQLEANQRALTAASGAIAMVQRFTDGQRDRISETMASLQTSDAQVVPLLRRIAEIVPIQGLLAVQHAQRVEAALAALAARDGGGETDDTAEAQPLSLNNALPGIAGARQAALTGLTDFNTILVDAINRFDAVIDNTAFSQQLRTAISTLRSEYAATRDMIDDAVRQLNGADSAAYDEFRRNIVERNGLVVTVEGDAATAARDTNRGVVVLPLTSIYPALRTADVGAEVSAEQGYKGEEAITGAIVRLTVDHDTRIVFLNPYPFSMLTPSANFPFTMSLVSDRLSKLNFRVEEWQPLGRMVGGQMMPAQPRPVPEPGQTLILVAFPTTQLDPRQPQMMTAAQQAMQVLEEHVAAGRPAMIFVEPVSPLASLGGAEQVAPLLSRFAISFKPTQAIQQYLLLEDGSQQVATQVILDDWPTDNEISRALRGLGGAIYLATPLLAPQNLPEGVTHTTLVRTGPDTWADGEFIDIDRAKRDDTDDPGPFAIAIAAERDGSRAVVIGDRTWATDFVAGQVARDARTGAQLFHVFPANTELFVNSVYWLAGLERLIGPGASSGDVRRIERVEPGTMVALRWLVLAGMPGACLLAGGIVYMLRRG